MSLHFPDEKTVACPYNNAHRIVPERLQRHLVRCRKQHPDKKMKICPFNATHQIPDPEFQYHLSICVDRTIIEKEKYKFGIKKTLECGNTTTPSYKNNAIPATPADPDAEVWDDEVNCGYNPQDVILNREILRMPVGKSKAARREFREEEQRRHDRLKQGLPGVPDDEEEENGISTDMPAPYAVGKSSSSLKDMLRSAPKKEPPIREPECVPVNAYLGVGRGKPGPPSTKRIAANIFGGMKKEDEKVLMETSNTRTAEDIKLINISRGRAMMLPRASASVSLSRPGAEVPVFNKLGRGRGLYITK